MLTSLSLVPRALHDRDTSPGYGAVQGVELVGGGGGECNHFLHL